MSQQPEPTQPRGPYKLGDLPQELVLSITNWMSIRDRCRLHQTCKSMHLLLADGITNERLLTAQVLPPKGEFEERCWKWSSPNTIAGIDMPDKPVWEHYFVFSNRPKESEIFACAIERGDLEAVKKYLGSGVDPNVYSLTGDFMLHIAVAAHQPGMVALLLEHGADPSYLDFHYQSATYEGALIDGGDSALILAFASSGRVDGFANDVARYSDYATMQACIDAGMDLNQVSSEGETVAHALAKRNNQQMFLKVAPHLTKETMTRVSKMHQTPLHVALKQSTPVVAMKLIEAGADTNPLDELIDTTLFTALEDGHLEPARLMLDRNAKLSLEKYTCGRELLAAITARDIGIILTLIHRGMSKEQDENAFTSPLVCAVRTESLEIVKLVYEEGPKPPSLIYSPGKMFSPSAYAAALALKTPEIADYLEGCMDRDSSDLQISCTPESDAHANMARDIMEIMSNLHHWFSGMFDDEVDHMPILAHQITLHVLPSAGADLDSSRIYDFVQKAQNICLDKKVSRPSICALVGAINGLGLSEKEEEEEEEEAGGKEGTDPDNAGLLVKALPRLLRAIRKEVDPKTRALFLETLKDVCLDHISTQAGTEILADTKRPDTLLLPPGMNDRARQAKETLTRLCSLARENVDNDEIDRLVLVFVRVLRC
ncbi:hypothetical protein PITC_052150 [Penicillium italicum]|uniref:F-box domain-containing protein n=1 Tax=Penicillium italicum TaxID=40296 RepID=A0A0A2KNU4_PENIT|nr:hypothetical protein PITC_052150 [Penicillium italicum]